jgi:hypothetical protein
LPVPHIAAGNNPEQTIEITGIFFYTAENEKTCVSTWSQIFMYFHAYVSFDVVGDLNLRTKIRIDGVLLARPISETVAFSN